ncbi:U3 small nucleolar RNA-associated protein 11 [Basidiobolus meristosporus CBS 931.73]|uniref:U3 small nucleolar RNA-associated protein 11 n=1 Tax=Basidiobolus meristosporus CBS 931.73 TaxID=1314790 RepID=A0A1Y1XX87_9FUNG|nr:U3 small nucleolar RNA-associated protein 11 [Basidiobolus meristosporus CBS 931.73]|eukprot:ORX89944.1 U3 small nucleolar RNA-associated protein 11 [Basidiobolus meristosporus CBS 931.73]
MSSLRNSVHRRTHRERSQPGARTKLGLLEKHKDYVLRARDYHSKQNRLKGLREKAYYKNPDEFYYKMISTKTKKGVHIAERNEKFSAEFLKLLKTQDVNYVTHLRDISKKKLDKLKESIHFLDEEGLEEDEEMEEEEEPAVKSNHLIFVDDDEQVEKFDAAKHFDTLPELMNRKYNRPKMSTLMTDMPNENPLEDKKIRKARENKYKELSSRMDREEKLSRLEQEFNTQKALMTKGRRKKVGVDGNGLSVYKWKPDRKK